MPRKNYTPAERALHRLATLAGKTQQEINDAIGRGDNKKMVPEYMRKEIPQGSLDMLRKQYASALGVAAQGGLNEGFWLALWDHCLHPKKVGDL